MLPEDAKKALFFSSEAGNKVHCFLCPHLCVIPQGSAGKCMVRYNDGGTLYSTVWGRPGAIAVEPIEKMPFYHFLPGSDTFSIGTAGCNLDCAFCRTHQLVTALPGDIPQIPMDPETLVSRARTNNCRTISFAYNEPAVFAEYMMSIAEVASRTEIRCVAVTNGFVTRTLIREVFRNIQAVNVELKSFEPSFYREYCKGRLEDVMRAIVELAELGLHIELSTQVIPDINDRPDVMRAQAAWIRDSIGMDTPLHLQAFVPTHRMTMIRPTALETLETLARVASDEGLRYVYVEDPASKFHHTRCRKCGQILIERDGSAAVSISLSPEGVCPTCGSEVPAVLY